MNSHESSQPLPYHLIFPKHDTSPWTGNGQEFGDKLNVSLQLSRMVEHSMASQSYLDHLCDDVITRPPLPGCYLRDVKPGPKSEKISVHFGSPSSNNVFTYGFAGSRNYLLRFSVCYIWNKWRLQESSSNLNSYFITKYCTKKKLKVQQSSTYFTKTCQNTLHNSIVH